MKKEKLIELIYNLFEIYKISFGVGARKGLACSVFLKPIKREHLSVGINVSRLILLTLSMTAKILKPCSSSKDPNMEERNLAQKSGGRESGNNNVCQNRSKIFFYYS